MDQILWKVYRYQEAWVANGNGLFQHTVLSLSDTAKVYKTLSARSPEKREQITLSARALIIADIIVSKLTILCLEAKILAVAYSQSAQHHCCCCQGPPTPDWKSTKVSHRQSPLFGGENTNRCLSLNWLSTTVVVIKVLRHLIENQPRSLIDKVLCLSRSYQWSKRWPCCPLGRPSTS